MLISFLHPLNITDYIYASGLPDDYGSFEKNSSIPLMVATDRDIEEQILERTKLLTELTHPSNKHKYVYTYICTQLIT
jgi:hypothetical protein